jgi:hypothetical protein
MHRNRSAVEMAMFGGWRAIIAAAGVLAASAVAAPHAEDVRIARLRAEQRVQFTDAEIFDGFFKTAFGAELQLAGHVNRIRKYEGPVRVAVENRGHPERRGAMVAVVADIAAHVRHLDIAVAPRASQANVVVHLVRDRDLARSIGAVFGGSQTRRIERQLDPECLSGFRKDARYRIEHSEVLLPVDSTFAFYDCAYEELLQSLGPINDSNVRWTMFNDAVHKGFFDVYDQYLLNILYDPRVRPGMTERQVRAVLPQVMPDVRAFVAKKNGLRG